MDHSDVSGATGRELVSGVEFTLALISSSSADRRLRFGLDLRQGLGRTDAQASIDVLSTRLGVRADFHPAETWRLGTAWFFGDTVVIRHFDRQYNGSRFTVCAAHRVTGAEFILELGSGEYREGPGFISLSRRPGDESFKFQSASIGVEWPFEFAMPSWMRP